jgi:hypothetical protein
LRTAVFETAASAIPPLRLMLQLHPVFCNYISIVD